MARTIEKLPFAKIENDETTIELYYEAPLYTMDAKEFAEAVLGLETCLKHIGLVCAIEFDSIAISPIQQGSIKTTFRYVKKHPLRTISYIAVASDLLVNSLTLIDRFGINSVKSPQVDVINAITDSKLLEVCKKPEFLKGVDKIAAPISSENRFVKISANSKSIEITCENKQNFKLTEMEEEILPELQNGAIVTLKGEITRINKTNNDLGFKYKGHIISVKPLNEEISSVTYHKYLELSEVVLIGEVVRENMNVTPSIRVTNIEEPNTTQPSLIVNFQ